jgi:hypothetical protein
MVTTKAKTAKTATKAGKATVKATTRAAKAAKSAKATKNITPKRMLHTLEQTTRNGVETVTHKINGKVVSTFNFLIGRYMILPEERVAWEQVYRVANAIRKQLQLEDITQVWNTIEKKPHSIEL